MVYYSVTSEHAYIVANFPNEISNLMLIYAPITLTIAPTLLFLFDLLKNKQKNWYLFFIAFIVNLSETVFVIGTLWFGGH